LREAGQSADFDFDPDFDFDFGSDERVAELGWRRWGGSVVGERFL